MKALVYSIFKDADIVNYISFFTKLNIVVGVSSNISVFLLTILIMRKYYCWTKLISSFYAIFTRLKEKTHLSVLQLCILYKDIVSTS